MNDAATHNGAIPANTLLARKVSYFATIRRKRETAHEMPLGTFLRQVKRGRWRSEVSSVREALRAGPPVARKFFPKEKLPAVKPSGLFDDLTAASLKEHSSCLCVDLDASDNPQIADDGSRADLCGRLRNDPHVLAYHVSAGGKGLAIYVAVVASNAANHCACFRTAAAYFYATFGATVDPHCSDVSRNRFVSFDPVCWWRTMGDVATFEPETEDGHDDEGCDIRSNVSCDIIYEKELPSPPPSRSEEVEERTKTPPPPVEGKGHLAPAIDPGPPDPEREDWPASPQDWCPLIEGLYERWLSRVTPRVGARNAIMVGRVPILLSVVGPKVTLWFMLRFYQQHRGTFADYPLAEFTRQTKSHIRACVESYPTNAKVGLNDAERAVYSGFSGRENLAAVFRICRSLSLARVNRGGPFHLTVDALSKRIACHPQVAGRQIEYLIAEEVLEIAEKGEKWQKGRPPRCTTYRWAMGASRRTVSTEDYPPRALQR